MIENGEIFSDEMASKYMNNWKSEIDFTLNQLKLFVDDDKLYNLQQSLIDWEESINLFEYTKREMLFGSNRAKYGTTFYNDCKLFFALNYREKVKELKYICFVLETNLDESLYSKNLKSLQFGEFIY